MIRVLVAEDSSTARALLVSILSADPAIEVVGEAHDGVEAVEMTRQLRPDIVTMDIDMPLLNGFEATKRIMIEAPTPIVIVTGISDARQVAASMQALACGALSLLQKPHGPNQRDFEEVCRQTVDAVKSLSQVKVVGHRLDRPRSSTPPVSITKDQSGIVAIAASTGGPSAIQRILSELPGDFPLPILIVQHLARGFVEGFALWLSGACPLRVQVAEQGTSLKGGTVYIAPDDRHLGARNGMAILDGDEPPIGGFRPSGTYLFSSVAKSYGNAVVAVILTGMGADGTAGLRIVKRNGGRVIAQDEDTSVVFGMPASAIAEGMTDEVAPLGEIAGRLVTAAERVTRRAPRGMLR